MSSSLRSPSRWGLVLAAGVALAPALARGQLPAETASRVDKVFAAYNRTDSPGCVLGVDREGSPLYRRGYGMASLELGVPLSEHSVLESGSVAKQFTAAAVTSLALGGKLSLDDPVRKYIPELPDYGAPVTVRMLLHHTSGVRDMWTLFTVGGQDLGTILFSMDRALAMVYRQKALNFPPNSQFLYSNSGFLLLAELVRRVSGKPLAEYSQEVFFRPLGMTHTRWRDDWNRVVPDRTTAYAPVSGGGFRVDMPYMSVYGAGGLLTTVGDLLTWNENLSNPKVGGREMVEAMETRGRLTSGRQIDYGLGLFIGGQAGWREVSHGGATGGYRTFLARYPDQRLSLAIVCNLASANPTALARQVVDVVLGTAEEAASRSTTTTLVSVPESELAALAGRYRAPASEDILRLAVRNGGLTVDGFGNTPLVALSPDRFQLPGVAELSFDPATAGKPRTLRLVRLDVDTTLYEAVHELALTRAQLAEFAGTYYSEELDATYQVAARDSGLVVRVGDGPELKLAPVVPGVFRGNQSSLRFARGKNGRVTGFGLFAGRVLDIRFTRRGP